MLHRSARPRWWKHEHHQQQGGTRVQEQHAHAGGVYRRSLTYVSKTVYPTAESYGTLAGVLRMLADDVEIMAREKEMGGGQ